MSRTKVAAGLIGLVMVMSLSACGMGSANLRGANGKLEFCDNGPHCVSSESLNPDRQVAPILYNSSRGAAHEIMTMVISRMKGAKIVDNEDGYMHVEFTSPIMHYVDDVELVFPEEKQIEIRSSSRIGYYDFGVNRERVETIRKTFEALQP